MGRALPVCLAILVGSAGLGGCGRRGPLELPPGPPAAVPASTAANGTLRDSTGGEQTRILENRDQPGLIQSPDQYYEKPAAAKLQVMTERPAAPPINRPPQPRPNAFVLDPLL